MTDPNWEKKVLHEGAQRLRQSERKFVVTVSLGEPFNGHCYKAIAAAIFLPPGLSDLC